MTGKYDTRALQPDSPSGLTPVIPFELIVKYSFSTSFAGTIRSL